MKNLSFLLLSFLSACLIHAAPQGSPMCSGIPENPAASQIGAQYLQVPGCGSDSGSPPASGGDTSTLSGTDNAPVSLLIPSATPSPSPAVSSALPSQPSSNAGSLAPPAPSGGGKCKPGFRNTVFNTGAPRNAGWPKTTWDSLTTNGVDDWIGFALDTLDKKNTYNTDSGPAATIPSLNLAQIHQIMDPTEVSAAVDLLKSNNPPAYLTLFNEPDYSYEGLTPLTSATDAAAALKPVFATAHKNTTFLSPALANANSDWLPTFRDACDGCMDSIPIIAMHLYNPDPTAALGLITQLHDTWPLKKIWITELAPGTGDCSLDEAGIVGWLNELIPKINALDYVEKIFWNCGESSPTAKCKTDLTNPDGSPTDLLKAYGTIC